MASKMRRAVARSPLICGGLGAQQMRERLVRQRLARLRRVARGERPVAGADGDDPAGERIEPALLAAAVEIAAERGRAVPDLAQRRPDEQSHAQRGPPG